MKNLNLIKRLWTDSHEKQKVRGMQKYCILLLLLFTCVTQAWAGDTPPTTKTASNLIIVKTTTETKSGWMWNGSSENDKARLFTKLGQKGSWYVSTFNNSTNKYTKMIAMNKDGFSDKSNWSGAGYKDGNKITGDVTLNSYTSGENQYLEKSSSEITHQFVHLSVSTSLSPSSSVTTGTAVSVRYTSLSGDLSDNTNNKWNFFYSTDGGTTKTRFSTENKSYPTSGSSAPSFTPSVAGSYKVYAYLSDPWGIEVIVREMNLTVSDPTYSVTYHANGGSGTKPTDGSSPYTSGSTVTVLGKNTLYKTGYVFAGWNTSSDGTGTYYAPGATFSITANTTLYAMWLDKAVLDGTNVMFYIQGYGNGGDGMNNLCNSSCTKASTSYKITDVYSYVNTSSSSSNLNTYDRISNNTKGSWSGLPHNDIHNAKGGELFQENGTSHTEDAKTATTAATPDGTNLSISTTCNSNKGVYNSKSLYILYYMNNEIVAVTYSGTPTMFIPASTSARASSISGLADGDYTMKTILTDGLVYYVAETDEFTISSATRTLTYDGNGAASGSAPAGSGDSHALNSYVWVADNTFTGRTNYSFDGWNTSPYIDGDNHNAGSSIQITDNITLYAKWKRTVDLDQNGATTSGSTSFIAYWNCSTLPSITNPSRTGYNFVEWNTQSDGNGSHVIDEDGNLLANAYNWTDASGRFKRTPSNSGSESSPLYAKWTAKTYTAEGNLKEVGGTSNGKYTATYDATSITINTTPTKTGYHVEGYYTSSDLTTKVANSEGVLVASVDGWTSGTAQWNKDANVPLYIKWTPNTYTVQFHRNGGQGDVVYQDFTYGVAQNLTANTYTRANYTFAGWALTTSGAVTYTDGAEVSNLATTGTFPLYAKWTEIPYTVTLQNATESSVSAGCGTGHSITAASAPFGMGFDHWEVVSGSATFVNANSATTTVKATSDCTVKAVYTQKLYAFIEGRFHVADASSPRNWTNTFGNGNWDQNSTRIPFSYDATRHVFYLHTYAKASELSTKISDYDPYFYIKTSSSSSSASDGSATIKSYKCNSSGTVSRVGYDNKIQFDYIHNNTTNTKNANLRFNSSDVTAYITIFFDGTYIWYEYMPAIINTINLSGTRVPPMAEITATPSMSYKGATDRAYCWAVYSDEECTSPVNVSFTSLGSGRVQFTVPQTIGTYYLKLTVRASAACNASIDDEEVQSFNVTTDNMVFFNKTDIPWSGVFVYFLGDGSYWDDNLGSGCASKDYGRANQMHRIGKSDIYYYEYSGNALGNNDIQYIAFTEYGKPSSEHFAYTNAAYREDFKRSCAPMYVPENWITDRLNNCEYYNRGYWTTYGVSGVARNAGFTLKVFDGFDGGTQLKSVDLSNTDGSNTYRATVNLDKLNYSYAYQLLSCGNKYYGNDGVMNANNSTNWKFEPDKHRCGLNSQASGDYDFIVQCTDGGEVRVSVEFPLMNGDYRLIYNDTCVYQTGWHPSQFIRHNYSDENVKLDTVSMYIRPDKQPVLTIQRCTKASSAPPTWENVGAYEVTGLTNGHGVYNFYISQAVSSGALTINGVSPYTGLYYIRTQQADGGWTGYKTNSDNVMTYTEYAEQKNYGFNYYKAKWVGTTGADVTFTIANDYSESLCDTMVADPGNNPLTAAEARSLPHTASIRFGWDSKTNTLKRAYINGSSNVSDRYLVMKGVNSKIFTSDGEGVKNDNALNDYEYKFADLNNWIYQADVKARCGATALLTAKYDNHVQDFIGTSSPVEKGDTILSGSDDGSTKYAVRVIYDFKTNRLLCAWLADGTTITEDKAINADVMIVRQHHEDAAQISFSNSAKLTDVKTVYGVLQLKKDTMTNTSKPIYRRGLYWISFPFDVKLSEVFGLGEYGTHWMLEYYDGAARAREGFWAESDGFWRFVSVAQRKDFVMKANVGYVIGLDVDLLQDGNSDIWANNTQEASLYFPSASAVSTIDGTLPSGGTYTVPEHECSITRDSRNIKDSHWNIIGVPSYANVTGNNVVENVTISGNTLPFLYQHNMNDNSIEVVGADDDFTFRAMHAYYVQYAGTIDWTVRDPFPTSGLAARRNGNADKDVYSLKLTIRDEEETQSDRALIRLTDESTASFELNKDLAKAFNRGKINLYTLIDGVEAAGNNLPLVAGGVTYIPVGVKTYGGGTYTISLPEGTDDLEVYLLDQATGARTNLAVSGYEVVLPNGVTDDRFMLEIGRNNAPTAVEGVDAEGKKVVKFIENDMLYILKDGNIYDARGARVK